MKGSRLSLALALALGPAATAEAGGIGRSALERTVHAASPPAGRSTAFVHDTYRCFEPVPESVGVRDVTDDGQTVRLDVLVLLDGIGRPRGVRVMRTASRAYEPLGIALQPTFRRVRFRNSGEYHEMEGAALRAVGGERPPGFDVVYVMTAKDLHSMGNYSIAGFAFCIGGVRDPKAAFAIGEGRSRYEEVFDDPLFSGKIAAHEIGHLLGAHHHYGNCAEGEREALLAREPSCTVMWPTHLMWAALNFGTLEAAVIRGHAVDFASP